MLDSELRELQGMVIRGLQTAVASYRTQGKVEPQIIAMLHACLNRILAQTQFVELRSRRFDIVLNGRVVEPSVHEHVQVRRLARILDRLHIEVIRIEASMGVGDLKRLVERIGQAWSEYSSGHNLDPALDVDGLEHCQVDRTSKELRRTGRRRGWGFSLHRSQAQRIYLEALRLSELWEMAGNGKITPTIFETRRVVQQVIEHLKVDSSLLLGLTAVKSLGEKRSTHSVNVLILCVAVGQTLRIHRIANQRLGLAAVLHDTGHASLDESRRFSNEPVTASDWDAVTRHGLRGAQSLLRAADIESMAPMIGVSLAHHDRSNTQGSKDFKRSWMADLIHVVDTYENLTRRGIQGHPVVRPDQALAVLARGAGTEFDTYFVKALVQTLGLYPPGTPVRLDRGETGVVVDPPRDWSQPHRPRVWLLRGEDDAVLDHTTIVDLADRDVESNDFQRSIQHTIDVSKEASCLEPFLASD